MLDALRVLGSAQAVTTATTTRTTNTVDFGGDYDMGPGEAKGIMFVINTAADFTTGDETHNFRLVTDDNTGFSSLTVLAETAPINGNLLTAGRKIVLALPNENERYIEGSVVSAGTSPTITWSCYYGLLKDMLSGPNTVSASGLVVG
jgi:hypothetical protein